MTAEASLPASSEPPAGPIAGPGGLPRRRSAVLFADLVESVLLFSSFENQVVERWHAFTSQVHTELSVRHRGRLVRTAGDGLLLEFASPPDAVAAALEMHALLGRFNQGHPEKAAFWLRIGIHLADIVAFPHELYGAGVNIAARLASLAQPGQTLASAPLRQALADGVHATVHDLGLRFVKHVEAPLRVFRLEAPSSAGARLPMAHDRPDLRPTLAVVPFVATPRDAEHDAVGHALADDIIASLARHPAVRVLTRASTSLLRDTASGLCTWHESVGASFMLSGHFYVMDGRVRVSVELSELAGGTVLWAGKCIGSVSAVFEGQDDLVPEIVTNVAQRIVGHELSRARSLPMDTLSSYTLFLGASGLMTSLLKSDLELARSLLEQLIERHPRQAAPYAMLARWQVFSLEQGWTPDRDRAGGQARELCERALDRDPESAAAHAALAQVCSNFEGDVEQGRTLNERAIALDPTHATAWAQLSGTLAFLGEGPAACAAVAECLRVSPLDPSLYLFESYAALAHIAAGNFPAAAAYAASSVRQHSLHAPGLHLLVGALWLNGEQEAARSTAKRYLSLFPNARAGLSTRRRLGAGQPWRHEFERALMSAGIPP